MTSYPLFKKIDERIERDLDEGDYAYFNSLMLKLEYLTKIVCSGLISCIGDDVDRHRYSLEHKLVRANSLGLWVEALNAALVGPPRQVLVANARSIATDLTKRVGVEDWRYVAVKKLNDSALQLDVKTNTIGSKVDLRQFFDIAVPLRNRTRGHGAPTVSQCGRACLPLNEALNLVVDNIELFRLPWVFLYRNLSGKYRVSKLMNDTSNFNHLKSERKWKYTNGVYFLPKLNSSSNESIRIPFIYTDPDILDIALPNGKYNGKTFETLSYVTNSIAQQDGAFWSDPPTKLPPSETEGGTTLEILGNVFTNTPPIPSDHIPRLRPEQQLLKELSTIDRHPIISLRGPGGIGKTTTTIAAIQKLSEQNSPIYEVILWISARDIDLLDSGPRPVSRRVFTRHDISNTVVEWMEPKERGLSGFDADEYFNRCLSEGAAGPTLFVLDNFETLQNPVEVVDWIDTYIRLPNKVLITTRYRDFVGDYPIEIGGMSEEEACKLIDQHAIRLGVTNLLNQDYKSKLVSESEGHPYVIKILLGEVAKKKCVVEPKRIFETSDRLLDALFERTYASLSPAGQRIFLLLSSWRAYVPEVAVEAVSLRPGTERFNVQSGLDELYRFSLIERVISDKDQASFVGVPLAATIFGQRELEVSPFKVSVEEDRKLLMEFGVGKRGYAHHGVFPRIENLFRSVSKRVSANSTELDKALPILEFLARQFPQAYLLLVDLILKFNSDKQSKEKAKKYVRQFLKTAETPEKRDAWKKLAKLCASSNDARGEIHALCEVALLESSKQEDLGEIANTLNYRIRELKDQRNEDAWSGEVQELLGRVIQVLELQLPRLSATNCSRLAWLHLNTGNSDRARDVVRIGVEREPDNEYCNGLLFKLEN